MQTNSNEVLSFNGEQDRVNKDTKLVQDIKKAIDGEFSAISCYKQLAENAPLADEMRQIREIRQDEIRHFQDFSQIYTSITGEKPSPQLTEECPTDYRKGLETAFFDEQQTSEFYLDIVDQAKDSKIKDIFRRAAADEQNHAVWFLYYLNRPQFHDNSNRQNEEGYGAKGALNAEELTFSQALIYAIQDEYLAQSRYSNILDNFGEILTFTRIKQAELRHIEALLTLFERYQIPVPEDDSAQFVSTPENVKDAYRKGVVGEIDNIAMYDRFLSFQLPEDARIVFTQLRNASVNHLEAFRRGLARG
ncbi:ferritin family protein [Halobacillus mangrovi]|uniref:Rubrerythrin family protein n=1 Tax=Halobacillus mangrovi TaxID=402384 RepID=A0A1W5ZV02_9BACI|nr:ferritin family protein [Halobacillus mangrovi]ARI77152.1 rubrerythrin family protein [Halobacillus mangrovi]